MMYFFLAVQTGRIGSPLLGVFVPAVILLISFAATWLLYRYFSRQ